ncbi:UNVERIFIED_CONTAM: hypothetical protein K2H54_029578 [Gekko kuhli]
MSDETETLLLADSIACQAFRVPVPSEQEKKSQSFKATVQGNTRFSPCLASLVALPFFDSLLTNYGRRQESQRKTLLQREKTSGESQRKTLLQQKTSGQGQRKTLLQQEKTSGQGQRKILLQQEKTSGQGQRKTLLQQEKTSGEGQRKTLLQWEKISEGQRKALPLSEEIHRI